MDQWDNDFIDLAGQGHITVDGDLDCRIEMIGGQEWIEFPFLRYEEGDEVSGSEWAVLESVA